MLNDGFWLHLSYGSLLKSVRVVGAAMHINALEKKSHLLIKYIFNRMFLKLLSSLRYVAYISVI